MVKKLFEGDIKTGTVGTCRYFVRCPDRGYLAFRAYVVGVGYLYWLTRTKSCPAEPKPRLQRQVQGTNDAGAASLD